MRIFPARYVLHVPSVACTASGRRVAERNVLCACLLLALCPSIALADDWINPGAGDWFLGSNWADGSVPSAVDDANIVNGGTSLVQLLGGTASNVNVDGVSNTFDDSTLIIRAGGSLISNSSVIASRLRGAVVIDGAGSTWSQANDLKIGAAGRGALTVQNGGVIRLGDGNGAVALALEDTFSRGVINVGNGGSPGFLDLTSIQAGVGFAEINFNHNDPAYFFTQNGLEGGDKISVSGRLAIKHIGDGTTILPGVYNLFSNSLASANSIVDSGVLVVSGALATDQDFIVGDSGSGKLRVEGGGVITSNLADIGLNSGASGSVVVDGASSSWNNLQYIAIGTWGRGALTIKNGGSVRGPLSSIAGSGGSSGVVTVNGSGSIWTSDGMLRVGSGGEGSLSIVNGGSVISSETRIGESWSGVGVISVDGNQSTWVNSGPLEVGGDGGGALIIKNGGKVTTGGLWVTIARGDGSSGSITVDGAESSMIASRGFHIGEMGYGSLNITNGGFVENTSCFIACYIGFGPGGGAVTVAGRGSRWVIGSNLFVGQAGAGTLTIKDGGVVSDDVARVVCCGVIVEGANSTWLNQSSLLVGRFGDGGSLTVREGGAVEVGGGAGVLSMAELGGKGILNIGSGAAPGVARVASVHGLSGTGIATVNFNHDRDGYFFTRDASPNSASVLITGNTLVNQLGSGTTTLIGAHTYMGATTINAGTLLVNGSITSSASVNNGGKLSGSGTVAAVNVADGGAIAPGSSVGTLTTGALTLANDSRLTFELAGQGAEDSDSLVVNGELVLDGVLTVQPLPGFASGTYRLISYSGTLANHGLGVVGMPAGYVGTVDVATHGQVNLVVTSGRPPANRAPTGAVTITGAAREGVTVSATSTLADADGLGTLNYQWFLDDTAVFGATGVTLALDDLAVGKMVRMDVSYTDGEGFAEQVSSAAVGPVAPFGTDLPFQKRLFFVNPADNVNQQTFIRLINPNDADVAVQIQGFDDNGTPAPGGDVVLVMSAHESLQINAADLELGNAGKGMDGALGNGVGKWQLKVNSAAPIEAMSLIRTPDGFLTSVTETVPLEAPGEHVLYFANPGSNPNQQSFIRVVNRGAASGEVVVSAVDDAGVPAAGGDIRFTLAANAALNFNAEDYTNGNPAKGLLGAFGTGTGKWRLTVTSALNLEVMSLIRTPDGFLTDLSNIAPRAAANDDSDRLLLGVNPGNNAIQQSLIRLVNGGGLTEHVILSGTDDAGVLAPASVGVDVPPFGAVQLLGSDLEQGNPAKGLTGAFGSGQGRWQIGVTPQARVEAQSLLRVPGGFLTNLSAGAPRDSRFEARLWIFNPGSNDQQRSILRLINRSDIVGVALIEAIDDAGQPAPGGSASLNLAPRAAVELSALELEIGSAEKGLIGALGDGNGKWRLRVSADVDIEVQGLLETPTGFLTNLSGTVH